MTNRILTDLNDIESQQTVRLSALKKYDGYLLKEKKRGSGKAYYSVYKNNPLNGKIRFRYAGGPDSETVKRVREARYLKKSLEVIQKDIKVLYGVLDKLEEIDSFHINKMMPAVYRSVDIRQGASGNIAAAEWKRKAEAYKATFPVYKPEELNVPTDDGNYVRSKSEALIYNHLLSLGVTFVYELPVKTKLRTFYPDFTILSEVDYKTMILIEHQGMMGFEDYRERYKNRVYDYLRAGYVQGVNIFYTFDNINGGLDMEPISDIIRLKIRPAA